jgi:hypothetical protein
MKPLTIRETLQYLGLGDEVSDINGAFIAWPPNVFCVAMHLLRESGAYVDVLNHFCDQSAESCDERQSRIKGLGIEWRKLYLANSKSGAQPKCPGDVRSAWGLLMSKRDLALTQIIGDAALLRGLLDLCSVADETCAGFGLFKLDEAQFLKYESARDKVNLTLEAMSLLINQLKDRRPAQLARDIDPSRAVVLPKMRTAQKGMTVRSLSHNLTLGGRSDLQAWWATTFMKSDEERRGRQTRSRNILVIPWPAEMDHMQFVPVPCAGDGDLNHLPGHHDFFAFRPQPVPNLEQQVTGLLREAQQNVGTIHGIVFPEMALSPDQFETVCETVMDEVDFVVGGVYEPPTASRFGKNYARMCLKIEEVKTRGKKSQPVVRCVNARQYKHHRWFLDRPQIETYGFSGTLDPARTWWECTEFEKQREIWFFALDSLMVFTVLICEDLARPEPVGDLIRAVGPNLVIALLQDGPQLEKRWPARYATSLADDPGSSVLTVTSIGMTQLSRPIDPSTGQRRPASRVVALWRDKDLGTRQIELPEGADAVVLTLAETLQEEWTLDGRSDGRVTGGVTLGGIRSITNPSSKTPKAGKAGKKK